MKSLSTQKDKQRMIFCIKSDLLALQTARVEHEICMILHEAIDLSFCKSNPNKQTQKEDIHEH